MSVDRVQDLLTRVLRTLENDQVLAPYDLEVEIVDGKVRLTGVVDRLADKWHALELARSVEGVQGVEDGLSVTPAGQVDDEEIREAVLAELEAAGGVDPHEVGASVRDGVVYLQGHVRSLAEEKAAIAAASRVSGVRDVVSQLCTQSGGARVDDVSIANEVERRLKSDERTSLLPISVTTRHGVVALEGIVENAAQMKAAEELATQVPGAKRVQNRLRLEDATEE